MFFVILPKTPPNKQGTLLYNGWLTTQTPLSNPPLRILPPSFTTSSVPPQLSIDLKFKKSLHHDQSLATTNPTIADNHY